MQEGSYHRIKNRLKKVFDRVYRVGFVVVSQGFGRRIRASYGLCKVL